MGVILITLDVTEQHKDHGYAPMRVCFACLYRINYKYPASN